MCTPPNLHVVHIYEPDIVQIQYSQFTLLRLVLYAFSHMLLIGNINIKIWVSRVFDTELHVNQPNCNILHSLLSLFLAMDKVREPSAFSFPYLAQNGQ